MAQYPRSPRGLYPVGLSRAWAVAQRRWALRPAPLCCQLVVFFNITIVVSLYFVTSSRISFGACAPNQRFDLDHIVNEILPSSDQSGRPSRIVHFAIINVSIHQDVISALPSSLCSKAIGPRHGQPVDQPEVLLVSLVSKGEVGTSGLSGHAGLGTLHRQRLR